MPTGLRHSGALSHSGVEVDEGPASCGGCGLGDCPDRDSRSRPFPAMGGRYGGSASVWVPGRRWFLVWCLSACVPTISHRRASLSGMAQGFGYLLASGGPVCAGAIHDLTGSWSAVFYARRFFASFWLWPDGVQDAISGLGKPVRTLFPTRGQSEQAIINLIRWIDPYRFPAKSALP